LGGEVAVVAPRKGFEAEIEHAVEFVEGDESRLRRLLRKEG